VRWGRRRGSAEERKARNHARYMLWHEGYPQELLADAVDAGAADAVVVTRDDAKHWTVRRSVAGHQQVRGRFTEASGAYDAALEWIYDICRDEGREVGG
jgi:hypothetical protein